MLTDVTTLLRHGYGEVFDQAERSRTMKRGEFVKALCTLGVCSCASFTSWGQGRARAEENSNAEFDALQRKLDFIRKRFAKLVAILDANLDESTRKEVFEGMGRECAKMSFGLTGQYAGRPEAFLDMIKSRGGTDSEYDEGAGTIRVVGESKPCACAFVDEKLTPPVFCDCSLGWQKETYAMILGQPVDAELEESVLRGGKRCVFRIHAVKRPA
jgi:predicted hydrocarbon binding protein